MAWDPFERDSTCAALCSLHGALTATPRLTYAEG